MVVADQHRFRERRFERVGPDLRPVRVWIQLGTPRQSDAQEPVAVLVRGVGAVETRLDELFFVDALLGVPRVGDLRRGACDGILRRHGSEKSDTRVAARVTPGRTSVFRLWLRQYGIHRKTGVYAHTDDCCDADALYNRYQFHRFLCTRGFDGEGRSATS